MFVLLFTNSQSAIFVCSIFLKEPYTFLSSSVDSDKPLCFCCLVVGSEWLRRSFPLGLEEALPYHIIPTTAMTIPKTTCKLRPSFPKKKESHNQNKDCLHMTKYLKRHSRKSADANELAEVGPHDNSACDQKHRIIVNILESS